MPGLTKSISCNGSAGSRDLLEDTALEENLPEADKAKRLVESVQQSPSEQKLATLFVRKRLDLARQSSPIMSHQSSPSDVVDPDMEKPLHLETLIKSLSIFSVCSLVLMLASLLLMGAFVSCSRRCPTAHICNLKRNCFNGHNTNITNGIALSTADRFLTTNTNDNSMRSDYYGKVDNKDLDENNANGLLTAGLALTAFVASASLICFLVCSLQCFFVSKILDLTSGYDRAYKYIYLCSRSRTLAFTGLLSSVPTFIAGILIFLLSQVSSAHFTTAVVFLVLGVVVCVVCAMQGYYYWRQEKTRADQGLPVYDSHFSIPKNALIRGSPKRQKELCTMV
ncbi:hypothetical protein PoB_004109900 [Plakobranchus ocellatus]|uniref:Uncharacterized protein n=1 Tax=Plakobranchus ocellatus TaxID=259542 RepID=A0AAV4B8B1_9GAST|nr:hypothetical protein PoB_004109900 [Plakobranchus ocellatus]